MELLSSGSKHAFSIRSTVLGFSFVVALCATLASSACENMRVFKGNELVTDEVCKKEYLTDDCMPFTESYDVSSLPNDPALSGSSVQSPGSFNVIATTTPYNGTTRMWHCPALNMAWTSPSADTARASVKGFYLWIQSTDKKHRVCRMFTIDHSQYKHDKLRFEYDLEKVSTTQGYNYNVRIYSLPLPSQPSMITDWMGDSENFKRQLVTTKDPFSTALDKVAYPGYWTTSITVDPNWDLQTVDVFFSLPDKSLNYGFTNYSVLIDDKTSNWYKEEHVYIPPSSDDVSGHVRFISVSRTGWFQVNIRVVDLYPDVRGRCQCYFMEESDFFGESRECKNHCPISRSAFFDLNGDVTTNPDIATHAPPPTTTTPLLPITTSHIKMAAAVDDGDDDDSVQGILIKILVPAILGGMLLAIVVVIITIKFRRGRKEPKHGIPSSPILTPEINGKVTVWPNPHNMLPPPSVGGHTALRRKTVFLLTSTDHRLHQVMVQHFVNFLKTYCHCDVFEANQDQGGGASWMADKLNKCDLILFLDSPGAFQRLQAYGENKEYLPIEKGPEGDLFNLGLQHIDKEIVGKNLGHLSQLPMIPDCLPTLPGMPEFFQAIAEAKTFEEENPDWFDTHYELKLKDTKKPKLERIVSNTDSCYGSMHGGQRSVTPLLAAAAPPPALTPAPHRMT